MIALQQIRDRAGMTLIEMISALFIMSFVAAAITGLAVSQNVVAFRTYSKMDSLTNARRALSQIEKDIRMARIVGDQFGSLSDCNQFPSTQNPLYSTSGAPIITSFSGYPQTTSNSQWASPPYFLNAQTLIVQVPIFQADGIPAKSSTTGTWNVDTYVYQIVADQSKPKSGQFVLQKALFPGEHQEPYIPTVASNSPQTLLTGIVGPIDPSTAVDSTAGVPTPKVFSFISRLNPLYTSAIPPTNDPLSYEAPNVNGIGITFEVHSSIASNRKDLIPKSVAIHKEVFLRGNYGSTP